MILRWLRSIRHRDAATSDQIRRRLAGLQDQRSRAKTARDGLALDAVTLQSAAEKYERLTGLLGELDEQIELLTEALRTAEEREAEAARRAEADSRAKRLKEFEQRSREAEAFVQSALASLPTGEVLTEARDLRDALRREAGLLRAWSSEVHVRRPVDPLAALVAGMRHRIDRAERSRWIGAAKITLGGTSAEELANATARVEALDRRPNG